MLSGFRYHTLTACIRLRALSVLLIPSKQSSQQKSTYRPSPSPGPVTLAEHASPKYFLGAYAGVCSLVVPRYRKGWRGDLCPARRPHRAVLLTELEQHSATLSAIRTHLIPAQHDSHEQGKVAWQRESGSIPCDDLAKLAAVEDVGEEGVSEGFVVRHGAGKGGIGGRGTHN